MMTEKDPAAEADTASETTVSTLDPSGEQKPLLQVEGLTKSYAGRLVVQGVSFTVEQGKIIGLLGKNGAGKTTTFRMTIGMVRPEQGNISFMGKNITNYPMYKRARLGMGYLSQEPSVFRGLTVEQNLNAILELSPMPPADRVRKRDELVEEFGLGRLLNSKAAVLSGGEKRRLEIARALIMEPRLILLDEPFAGVDAATERAILDVLEQTREAGRTLVVVHHDLATAAEYFDSLVLLKQRCFAHGPPESVLHPELLSEVYEGSLRVFSHLTPAEGKE